MDQIDRIMKMEGILRSAEGTLKQIDSALEQYEAIQDQIATLDAYYGSDEWRYDLDCDTAGLLPSDLRRGVLSEDEVYDLLILNRELLTRMQEIIIKNEADHE